MWLKRRTTARGAPRDKKTREEAWIKTWDKLPQERINTGFKGLGGILKRLLRIKEVMNIRRAARIEM
jgi:hypothetical protein